MSARPRSWRGAVAVALALTAVAPAAACGARSAPTARVGTALVAQAAGVRFLDTYVDPDGRVVRHDQGGDTVSEGQAYALLVAVAVGDEARFRSVWSWTRAHLERDDALLAVRWADGAVVDDSPAADADLLAALALARAAGRFDDPALADAAGRLGAAVLEHETVETGFGPLVVAGPWARDDVVVNPSYLATVAMSELYRVTGEERWAEVAATARAVLADLTAAPPHLAPDWATVTGTGADATGAPDGDDARWGYEAVRVNVQLAVDCDARGQQIAAAGWPFLRDETSDDVEVGYARDGTPVVDQTHPVALVAAAASAAAAGDLDAAASLLDEAAALDQQAPSYYGAAWVALGRLWLDTDELGACRPGAPGVTG